MPQIQLRERQFIDVARQYVQLEAALKKEKRKACRIFMNIGDCTRPFYVESGSRLRCVWRWVCTKIRHILGGHRLLAQIALIEKAVSRKMSLWSAQERTNAYAFVSYLHKTTHDRPREEAALLEAMRRNNVVEHMYTRVREREEIVSTHVDNHFMSKYKSCITMTRTHMNDGLVNDDFSVYMDWCVRILMSEQPSIASCKKPIMDLLYDLVVLSLRNDKLEECCRSLYPIISSTKASLLDEYRMASFLIRYCAEYAQMHSQKTMLIRALSYVILNERDVKEEPGIRSIKTADAIAFSTYIHEVFVRNPKEIVVDDIMKHTLLYVYVRFPACSKKLQPIVKRLKLTK